MPSGSPFEEGKTIKTTVIRNIKQHDTSRNIADDNEITSSERKLT